MVPSVEAMANVRRRGGRGGFLDMVPSVEAMANVRKPQKTNWSLSWPSDRPCLNFENDTGLHTTPLLQPVDYSSRCPVLSEWCGISSDESLVSRIFSYLASIFVFHIRNK